MDNKSFFITALIKVSGLKEKKNMKKDYKFIKQNLLKV